MAADGMELAPLKLDEIEADAATFRKIDCNNGEVNWLEYDGLKRRGDRTSLVLERNTNKGALGSAPQKVLSSRDLGTHRWSAGLQA